MFSENSVPVTGNQCTPKPHGEGTCSFLNGYTYTSLSDANGQLKSQVGRPKGTQFATLLGEALLGAAQNALLLELQDQGPWDNC